MQIIPPGQLQSRPSGATLTTTVHAEAQRAHQLLSVLASRFLTLPSSSPPPPHNDMYYKYLHLSIICSASQPADSLTSRAASNLLSITNLSQPSSNKSYQWENLGEKNDSKTISAPSPSAAEMLLSRAANPPLLRWSFSAAIS